jgi:predicted acyl esterase
VRLVTSFPHRVTADDAWIPLPDGCRLAARIWRPEGALPVPAILAYLPYRQRDLTAERDAQNPAWFAGHGYAGVRVDLRGSGDSDGVI